MASKLRGNWRNKSIIEVSDSEDELVESSFIVKSIVYDSDDDQVKSSLIVESNDGVIPSSPDVESDDSFCINYRKKVVKPILVSDDDEDNASYERCFNERKSSNSASLVEENNNRHKNHEVDSLKNGVNTEQCLLSSDDLKNIDDSALGNIKKEEKSENSFCSLHCGVNDADAPYDSVTQSAILESLHNNSITFHKAEVKESPTFNLEEKENCPADSCDINNVKDENELSVLFSKNVSLDNSSVHYNEDQDNLSHVDYHMQSAILDSLNASSMKFREDESRSLKCNSEKNQVNNIGSFIENYDADIIGKDTLLAETVRLEYEIRNVTASIKNKKSTLHSVNLNVLPDKGLKLKVSLAREERSLETLLEQLNRVKNKIGSSFVDSVKKAEILDEKPFKFSSLPSADLRDMGERALENHRVEQALTVESLRTLHNSLKSCPSDDKTVVDPYGLKVPLMDHQKQALAWLVWREKEKPSGGILADDMGLGKTLTMISLILKKNEESENDVSDEDNDFIDTKTKYKGGTLIICPSSLIGQWESEIRRRVRNDLLSYEIHHGQKREKKAKRLTRYDVVITTYAIARVEYENFTEGDKVGSIFHINWKRIILDEAHTIRNHKSKTAKAVFMLKGIYRWALTGTPVHNKTQDFFALIKFIRCRPFDDIAVWKKWVEAKDETGSKRLDMLTKSLMLRRTKHLLMSEGKLPSLPEKSFEIILVQLGKEEWKLYEEVSNFSKSLLSQLLYQRAEKQELLTNGIQVSKTMIKGVEDENRFVKHPALNKLYKRMVNMKNVKTHEILVLLLRLRQICCHPALIKSMVEKEVFVQDGIVEEEGSDLDLLEKMSSMTLNNGDNDSLEDEENELECSKSNIFNHNNHIFDPEWPSSKIKAILRLLEDTILKTHDRIVIVSQWSSMLELIGNFLKKLRNCKYESLTGKVPVDKRMDIVSEFNSSSSSIRVLLLSLTAGGTGLNLVGGNHLILTDLHWNPQQEAQACDRIYRMGQTKPVKIYKFFCAETIEERIQQLQINKLALADGVLSGARQVQVAKLSLNDLKMLFNIK